MFERVQNTPVMKGNQSSIFYINFQWKCRKIYALALLSKLIEINHNPAGIYLFKVNNKCIRTMSEIRSVYNNKDIIAIVKDNIVIDVVLVSLLLTLNK